jgi:3-hydroxyisobutyrate dehydrogenase-like beta-hydroxyacid dehydrogenase
MEIGFIGLGAMGAGIARNLIKGGHQVTAWNRSPGPLETIKRDGAKAAATPADAMKGEMVFSMLANDAALEHVGFAGPLLKEAAPGLIHINMATISLPLARRLAEAHASAKIGYVACPVFGRPDAAAAAQLQLIAGGDAKLIEKVRPVLEPLGRRLVIAGDKPEQANLFKITGNFMTAVSIETYGEAIALLRKGGVDVEAFYGLMSEMYYSGSIHKLYGRIIADEKYDPPGFKLKHGYKDAGLALESAKLFEAPLPLAGLVHDHFLEAMAAGQGDKDWALIADMAAKRAGLK